MDSAALRAHFEKISQPDTPRKNGLALLSLLSNLPPLSYNGLSHTRSADALSVAVIDMQIAS